MEIDDLEMQEIDNIFNDAYKKSTTPREAWRYAMMRYAEIYHDRKVKKLNEPAVSGSCFWGHKWTKWEQYNASMLLIADMKTEYKQLRQRRTCLRCGKMELEDL